MLQRREGRPRVDARASRHRRDVGERLQGRLQGQELRLLCHSGEFIGASSKAHKIALAALVGNGTTGATSALLIRKYMFNMKGDIEVAVNHHIRRASPVNQFSILNT